MLRKARIDAPGVLHHIICRGIEQRRIFYDNADRDDFVKRLSAILLDKVSRNFLKHSTSSSSSRLVAGNYSVINQAEKEYARFLAMRMLCFSLP